MSTVGTWSIGLMLGGMVLISAISVALLPETAGRDDLA